LGESDEKPIWPADVAEPIRIFILDDFAYKLRAARAEPFKRLVDVVHGEHHAEVAKGVDRGVPVICDDRRREKAGELEPAVTVRCAHHGNLDTLIAQPSDAPGPFSFDRSPPFELEAEFAKEINRSSEVFDDDSYVVHPLDRHVSNLQRVVPIYKVPPKGVRFLTCTGPHAAARSEQLFPRRQSLHLFAVHHRDRSVPMVVERDSTNFASLSMSARSPSVGGSYVRK
jgi:hypothetical protein